MAKEKVQWTETNYPLDKIKQTLAENNVCYVLITCKAPSQGGEMEVEMAYDGDEVLASYLIDNAQQIFENNRIQSQSQ